MHMSAVQMNNYQWVHDWVICCGMGYDFFHAYEHPNLGISLWAQPFFLDDPLEVDDAGDRHGDAADAAADSGFDGGGMSSYASPQGQRNGRGSVYHGGMKRRKRRKVQLRQFEL